MQRGRQGRGTDLRSPSAGFEEREAIEPSNSFCDSNAPVEVEQIRAASEQHVLAVVYYFPGSRMLIRGGPTANKRPALEQADSKSRIGEGTCGGESSDASAHDSHSRMLFFVGQSLGRTACYIRAQILWNTDLMIPRPRMLIFSVPLSRTL